MFGNLYLDISNGFTRHLVNSVAGDVTANDIQQKKRSAVYILSILLSALIAGCNSNSVDTGENNTDSPNATQVQSGPVSTSACTGTPSPSDITDIILATGQSNLIGPDTTVAATLDQFGKVVEFQQPDQPHPYVFAWNVDPANNNAGVGWRIASLTQSWHKTNPGVGGIAHNNLAFHFAKQVANRASTCKVIGLVMMAEGGKGISYWDFGESGWNQVVSQVSNALEALGRTSIDGIIWHQGESDWIVDGTCYPGSACVNNAPDFYAQKLYSRIADPSIDNPYGNSALIDRLRRQSWFGDNKPFIAAETLQAPVNVHLRKLNTDDDYWTGTVRGDAASGLEFNNNDPFGNHYSASGLRILGGRYAIEYLRMKNY